MPKILGIRMSAALKAGDIVITPKVDRMLRSAVNSLDLLGQLSHEGVKNVLAAVGAETWHDGTIPVREGA